ncbi:pentatricopeptide repeat-containing protein At3g09060-like [Durio zibethinus]|uniref:Pentatricopeptide repeat-containing protein At3g09060-like n=1 Tax=Durio zibethinus TaxID=66656 RepID=A0A6P5Z5Z3_DURZI|nr:pentatricopeptide repeat-containing protein At3g09060-like [Durio zibethinus]
MKQIFGCEPWIRSYSTLLNAFAESNRWEQAESLFKHFETVGKKSQICKLNILIKVACKRKHFDHTKRLLDWICKTGFHPNVQSYWTLINGLVKGGNLVIALELFDEMFKRKVTPDVMCYNIVIDGFFFFRKREFVEATEVWVRLLEDSSAYPNSVTYNIMINGLCKCGKFDKCLRFPFMDSGFNLSESHTLLRGSSKYWATLPYPRIQGSNL